MGLKVFYFVAQMGDRWRNVVREQLAVLQSSGLYDACEKVYICSGGKSKMALPPKCKCVYWSHIDQFEYPALHMVKEYTQPDDTIFYMHTKGVSRTGPRISVGDQWREYLMWGCVERWQEHIEALKTHDVSGVQLTELSNKFKKKCGEEKVYAGNFWFARGDYIAKLTAPEIVPNRWGAEGWIMGASPKCFDLHNLTGGKAVTNTVPFNADFKRSNYDKTCLDMVASRHEILNALIEKFDYKRYLEIGVYGFHCFNHVQCKVKECVDPNIKNATHVMTSDAFFEQNKQQWDIIFIDGLHTDEQVTRDVENALQCLAPGGTIMMHDCNPETEWEQRAIVDYDNNGVWVGDVWKAFARFRMTCPYLYMAMIDTDFGCGIIRKGTQKVYPSSPLTYTHFVRNRESLMNVINPEDFKSWLAKLA